MQPNQIEHIDNTATQGWERPGDNTISLFPGDCQRCLLPYLGKGGINKVWTANGMEYWCADCTRIGLEKNYCIRYRSLDKKQRKELKKYAKQQGKSFE